MTKTTKTKKTSNVTPIKAHEAAASIQMANYTTPVETPELTPAFNLGFSEGTIKSLCVLAASLIFASPAFATQANPNNIVSLSDMFYRYTIGSIIVASASEEAANTPKEPTAPTFG